MRAAVAAVVLVVSAALWTVWVSSGALDPVQVAAREGEALMSLYRVAQRHDDGDVVVVKGSRRFVVQGMPVQVQVGEELSLTATVNSAGQWQMTWLQRHPGRPAKRGLGIVGLVATALMLAVGTRRRDGWVWFRG